MASGYQSRQSDMEHLCHCPESRWLGDGLEATAEGDAPGGAMGGSFSPTWGQ